MTNTNYGIAVRIVDDACGPASVFVRLFKSEDNGKTWILDSIREFSHLGHNHRFARVERRVRKWQKAYGATMLAASEGLDDVEVGRTYPATTEEIRAVGKNVKRKKDENPYHD